MMPTWQFADFHLTNGNYSRYLLRRLGLSGSLILALLQFRERPNVCQIEITPKPKKR